MLCPGPFLLGRKLIQSWVLKIPSILQGGTPPSALDLGENESFQAHYINKLRSRGPRFTNPALTESSALGPSCLPLGAFPKLGCSWAHWILLLPTEKLKYLPILTIQLSFRLAASNVFSSTEDGFFWHHEEKHCCKCDFLLWTFKTPWLQFELSFAQVARSA